MQNSTLVWVPQRRARKWGTDTRRWGWGPHAAVPDAIDAADSWPAVTSDLAAVHSLVGVFGVQLDPWQTVPREAPGEDDDPEAASPALNAP